MSKQGLGTLPSIHPGQGALGSRRDGTQKPPVPSPWPQEERNYEAIERMQRGARKVQATQGFNHVFEY